MYTPDNKIQVKAKGHTFLPIDRLLEFQGNLKRLTQQNREKLMASILEKGFIAPIFVWDDAGEYRLLDGHQRIKTLLWMRQQGWDIPMLPVDIIEADDEHDAKKKLLAITSQYGEFTVDGYAEFTYDIELEPFVRLVDGEFDYQTKTEEETEGDDEVPEVKEEVMSKLGEIYELGEHRLMCGDSTNTEHIKRLMNGELADILVTDPPYNVALGHHDRPSEAKQLHRRTDGLVIENDSWENEDDFIEFLRKAFVCSLEMIKAGAVFYIWYADTQALNFRLACKSAGMQIRQNIIWNKSTFAMGRQDYQWKHEPCLYGWKDGAAHLWSSDRKQTTVIDFQKPSKSEMHPTMKPVGLIEYQILNNTKGQDIVLDIFGGSGTTLIASAKNQRKCRIMELDPVYCDVIRRRWTKWANENGREVGSGGLE